MIICFTPAKECFGHDFGEILGGDSRIVGHQDTGSEILVETTMEHYDELCQHLLSFGEVKATA